eukprot:1879888-Alexandrium_andersonii.AAC.1
MAMRVPAAKKPAPRTEAGSWSGPGWLAQCARLTWWSWATGQGAATTRTTWTSCHQSALTVPW